MDIDTNVMQYTEAKLRKMASRFLLLEGAQRLIPVPSEVAEESS